MWSDNGSLSLPPPPSLTPSTPTHHLAVMWLYATPYIPILVPSLAWVWGYPIPPRPPSNFINVRIRYLYIIISVEVIGCVVISSSWAQNCHNIISQDLAIVLGHLIIETHKHNQSLTIGTHNINIVHASMKGPGPKHTNPNHIYTLLVDNVMIGPNDNLINQCQ